MRSARRHRTQAAIAPLCILFLALGACSSDPVPLLEDVPSAEALYDEGLTELAGRRRVLLFKTVDYDKAIETFQAIIDNYPYSEYAVLAEIKIADAYFEQERYEEALTYYREFGDLHPSHDLVPYTVYRTALSHYNQTRDPGRDQTPTRQTLVYLDHLLSRYPGTPEANEAEVLWRAMRRRLAEHVMEVADYYMTREEYQSAAERYRRVLNEYPGLGLDADALYRLGTCYQALHRQDEAAYIFEVVLRNYSESELADIAAETIPEDN